MQHAPLINALWLVQCKEMCPPRIHTFVFVWITNWPIKLQCCFVYLLKTNWNRYINICILFRFRHWLSIAHLLGIVANAYKYDNEIATIIQSYIHCHFYYFVFLAPCLPNIKGEHTKPHSFFSIIMHLSTFMNVCLCCCRWVWREIGSQSKK